MSALQRIAAGGCILWLALAIAVAGSAGPLSLLDLLLLLGPLVIVPLGLDLISRQPAGARFPMQQVITVHQATSAPIACASFWFEPGALAGALTVPWLVQSLAIAFWGASELPAALRAAHRDVPALLMIAARLFLPVGAAWFVLSRAGAAPPGIGEPFAELTAVHFHFTGFAAPILLAQAAPWMGRWHMPQAGALLSGIPVVATGFTLDLQWVRLAGVILIAGSLISCAARLLAAGPRKPAAAGILPALSALCVLAGMPLALVYAIRELTGPGWPAIPEMVRRHGVLNGLGFSLCGMPGWSLRPAPRDPSAGR